jgi:hypothetical protein
LLRSRSFDGAARSPCSPARRGKRRTASRSRAATPARISVRLSPSPSSSRPLLATAWPGRRYPPVVRGCGATAGGIRFCRRLDDGPGANPRTADLPPLRADGLNWPTATGRTGWLTVSASLAPLADARRRGAISCFRCLMGCCHHCRTRPQEPAYTAVLWVAHVGGQIGGPTPGYPDAAVMALGTDAAQVYGHLPMARYCSLCGSVQPLLTVPLDLGRGLQRHTRRYHHGRVLRLSAARLRPSRGVSSRLRLRPRDLAAGVGRTLCARFMCCVIAWVRPH